MKYLTAWSRVSDPSVWHTYRYPRGFCDSNDRFNVGKEEKENFETYEVNLSDWLNHYAEEGFRIDTKIQNEDHVLLILSR